MFSVFILYCLFGNDSLFHVFQNQKELWVLAFPLLNLSNP